MKSLISGYILAFFTVMMWSLNLIYSKYLAGAVTPAEISFYRWFFAWFANDFRSKLVVDGNFLRRLSTWFDFVHQA